MECLPYLRLFFLLMFGTAMLLHGQVEPSSRQAFETAAIHPSRDIPGCTNILPPGSDHFEVTCVPLRALVQLAFRPDELEGHNTVLDTSYDIRATLPDKASWTMDSVAPLLRTLLTERFHLTFHSQSKSVPGFNLVVGPHGSRMKAAQAPVSDNKNSVGLQFLWPGRVQGRGVDADGIAGLLSLAKHAHIVNATGLSGRYDIDLRYATEDGTATDLPEFSTALKEQLGLELKPASVPITVMVVDHADAEPSPN